MISKKVLNAKPTLVGAVDLAHEDRLLVTFHSSTEKQKISSTGNLKDNLPSLRPQLK